MRAYEFYLRDAVDKVHLIGILPERRADPQRIDRVNHINEFRSWFDMLTTNGL